MTNNKDIGTKSQAMSEGSKESDYSLEGIMKEVKTAQSSLPNFLDYNKKYRAEAVSNKAGFTLNSENKMIMGGK